MQQLFPKPLPDESIFSLICRFHLLSGQASFKGQTLQMLGMNSSRPSNEFPSFLPKLANLSGIHLEYLVKRMTSAHYYEPFIDTNNYKLLLNAMTMGSTANLQSKLGMVANRITPGQYLKSCPLCAEHDEEKYGVAYWHVQHQLIGLSACPLHNCHLVNVKRNSVRIILPYRQSSFEEGLIEECDVAKIIVDEFNDFQVAFTRNELIQAYLSKLSELGLITEFGHIRQKQLKQYLADKLNALSHCSQVFKLLSYQTKQGHYPECLFYASHCNHQPIKHFFLIYSLFGSWKSLCDFFVTPKGSVISSHESKSDIESKEINWTEAIDDVKNGSSMRTVAERHNTTVSTLKIKAQQQGAKVNTRPSKLFKSEERGIWRKLFIGMKTQDIAKQFDLSVGAIEKVLSKHSYLKLLRKKIWYFSAFKTHQNQILYLLNSEPSIRRNQIKQHVNASYMWLYKHEKDWLYQNIPAEVPRGQRYIR